MRRDDSVRLERDREPLNPTRANTMATSALLAIRYDDFADEWADRPKKRRLAARPCDERALAGDEGAEPKIRQSTKDALFIAGSYDKEAAARLVGAGRRVANMKERLQEAQAQWQILKMKMKLKTLQDAKDAELKIRPSKEETLTHARAPDVETAARLENALEQVADLKEKLLRVKNAEPKI